MFLYLSKILYLLVFALIIIFNYYKFDFHIESFSWYLPYVITMFLFYFSYKAYNYVSGKKKLSFTPIKLFWYFLIQLFVLSILFFTLNDNPGLYWITLFFKILGYLILPIIICLSFISFWRFILEKINSFKEESNIFQFLVSLWVWFSSFLTFITLFWFFWFYNIWSVFWALIVIVWVSYKKFFDIIKSLFNYQIEIDNHDFSLKNTSIFSKINLYLLSSEFLFIIICFLISINFISIVRPIPIGWDDLWVYMNFPNLMASNGGILNLWWMYAWQVFSGIWYLFSWATQAFFLNNIGGVLSVLVIILSFNDLLKSDKKTFINIPFLAWAIFLAMPMIIFQQAKDMKLDSGLFFLSVIVLYMIFYIFLKYLWYKSETNIWNLTISDDKNKENEVIELNYNKKTKNGFVSYFTNFTHIWEDIFSRKSYLIYLFIIWILTWIAFSIKFTSLLLISATIWVIFYSKLWIAWFFAYISFYIAIFTKLWFWNMMNVIYPKDDINFVNNVFLYGIIIWVLLLWYSINKYRLKAFNNFVKILSIFILWVFLWVSPWIGKNIISTDTLTISNILNWKTDTLNIDYTKIYSQEELDEINSKIKLHITESWITKNEDLWRYFGYEKWINNYIKLPYNLTMQINQKWEYTDITYIFFALFCSILFISFKNWFFAFWAFLYTLVPLLFFFNSNINLYFTNIFSQFELPFWYIIISLFFIIPFLFFIYSLNKEKKSVLFKLNLVFWMFYVFLWTISAFWIVWYGIIIYYNLLFAFWIWIYYISSYSENSDFKEKFFKFLGSIVVLFIVWVYFFNSSFPHWFNNLKNSWYSTFKYWITDNYTTIFESHPDYFDILVELNISKDSQKSLFENIVSKIKNQNLIQVLNNNNINNLLSLNQALKEISNLKNETNNLEIKALKKEAKNIRSNLLKNVLYPEKNFKNELGIYRIWTFLKYFISNNHKRLLEDSLITEFQKYFYDEKDINIWIERMKKVWISYFLVDLNAATIDKDPARNLTARFETLLKTFTSDKLQLIHTDSICLKIALEDYNKSEKSSNDFEKYLRFAWVNYESYTSSGETINRWIKQLECYNYILSLIQEEKINDKDYTYLLPISKYIKENKFSSQEELLKFFQNYVSHGWLVLFRIK